MPASHHLTNPRQSIVRSRTWTKSAGNFWSGIEKVRVCGWGGVAGSKHWPVCAAAHKCRQRRKQWISSLQSQNEYYQQENDRLTNEIASLREEVVNLKTLLLRGKDCPI